MDSREKALVGGDEAPGFLAWPAVAAAVRGEPAVAAAAAATVVMVGPMGLRGAAGLLVVLCWCQWSVDCLQLFVWHSNQTIEPFVQDGRT